MKKTPLRRRSKKTEAWVKVYRPEVRRRIKEADGVCQRCKTPCGKLDPHHYAGSRQGKNILRFVIVGRRCHNWIHEMPRLARTEGLLALPSGYVAFPHPAVVRAEERYKELMETIKQP